MRLLACVLLALCGCGSAEREGSNDECTERCRSLFPAADPATIEGKACLSHAYGSICVCYDPFTMRPGDPCAWAQPIPP